MVTSTTADYFVLYVKHDVDGTEVELPVLVKLGDAGTTTLAENIEALPANRYRVEKYLIADPADVDGDCIADTTELADPVGMNPVNPAAAIEISDGAVAVPDKETFRTLAFSNTSVKFVGVESDTALSHIYFANTRTHQQHSNFMDAVGIDQDQDGLVVGGVARRGGGFIAWLLYANGFKEISYSVVARFHTLLAASMPVLEDNLALHIRNGFLRRYQTALPLLRESRVELVFDADIYAHTDFLALNPNVGYGRLRVLEPDERPHPRDVVIYEALPNELPRVAGIISTVPQTPLSHVNLRAIQNGIPNAYIRDAVSKSRINALLGSYVRYEVTEDGWKLRAATVAEVNAHYESSRPTHPQTPERDLAVTEIRPLGEVGFHDWTAFGVKAANLAVLGTLGFPTGTVPDGFCDPVLFLRRVHEGPRLLYPRWNHAGK